MCRVVLLVLGLDLKAPAVLYLDLKASEVLYLEVAESGPSDTEGRAGTFGCGLPTSELGTGTNLRSSLTIEPRTTSSMTSDLYLQFSQSDKHLHSRTSSLFKSL